MQQEKPVVFPDGKTRTHGQNDLAQRLIMKAIGEGITDPNDLKKIAGLRTAAELYRTLDKMSLRREYHAALTRSGIDFDYLVGGVKNVCDTADPKVALKGFEILMRSLGVEKYDKETMSNANWEDTLLKASEAVKAQGILPEPEEDYTVKEPEVPEAVKEKQVRDKAFSDSYYDRT